MNGFCPDGYISTPTAILTAAEHWFPELFSSTAADEAVLGPKSEDYLDAAARALSQPLIPDSWRRVFEKIASQTVPRVRNLLHQGRLEAFYFANDGRHSVEREFWATAPADGVLESGIYWPFGRPNRPFEQRLDYALFLFGSDLEKLLNEQDKKRPFAKSRMPELVDALRRLDNLPNRKAQFQAVKDLPKFREFKITYAILREAVRQLPSREPGRKSK